MRSDTLIDVPGFASLPALERAASIVRSALMSTRHVFIAASVPKPTRYSEHVERSKLSSFFWNGVSFTFLDSAPYNRHSVIWMFAHEQ